MKYKVVMDMKACVGRKPFYCMDLESSRLADAMLEAQWKANRFARELHREIVSRNPGVTNVPALGDVPAFAGVNSLVLVGVFSNRQSMAFRRFYPSDCRWMDVSACGACDLVLELDLDDVVDPIRD